MLSLIAFFILLSSGSFYMTAKYGRRYEETVPLTIFASVEIVFLFGLIDNLKLGVWVCCVGAVVLYVLGLRRIVMQKHVRQVCTNLFTPAFFIFLVLLIIYAVCIVGWVPYHWDSFYFWALSVKQMFFLNAFHCVPPAVTLFAEYPPGMQIVEYIALTLKGSFTEWRMMFAYGTFLLSLFLPFLRKMERKSRLQYVLIALVIFFSGSIFFPQAFTSLYVDLPLGVVFGYGMAKVFLLSRENGRWNTFELADIIMSANMLILIKSAGMLFAGLVLLSLLVTVCAEQRKKEVQNLQRRNLLLLGAACCIPLITAQLWKFKYTQNQGPVFFETSKYDLMGFIRILLGQAEDSYRTPIKDSFFQFLVMEKIQVGFLTLSNLQLLLLFAAGAALVCYLLRSVEIPGKKPAVALLFCGVFIYWLGLMASYMYTFPEHEGPVLASMQRYLNIYHTAIMLFIIFLLLRWIAQCQPRNEWSYGALVLLLSLCAMPEAKDILTGNVVKTGISSQGGIPALVEQIESASSGVKEDAAGVLLIDKASYNGGSSILLKYKLFPDYWAPMECSYGTTPLFDGDGYTQILTPEEFRQHVNDLGVDYLALELLDEDFIVTYAALFDSPLENGQVYKVVDETGVFQKMNG